MYTEPVSMGPPARPDADEVASIRQCFPNGTLNLRACIRCRIIMTKQQFLEIGCPTCGDVLHMTDNENLVVACTSPHFTGYIAVLRPGAFVSRFNGLEKRRPGLYALTVHGKIPEGVLHESDYEREEDDPIGNFIVDDDDDGRKSVRSHKSQKSNRSQASQRSQGSKRARAEVPSDDSEGESDSNPRKRKKPVSGSEGNRRSSAEESANNSAQPSEATAASSRSSALILQPEGDDEFKRQVW